MQGENGASVGVLLRNRRRVDVRSGKIYTQYLMANEVSGGRPVIVPPMEPTNPIDAVTHPNPYPYYGRLLSGPALHYDQELRLWIAASATTISEVFDSSSCRVRPTIEPVPAALRGLPTGEIFAHLMRMTDGGRHDQPKIAVERALASIPAVDIH